MLQKWKIDLELTTKQAVRIIEGLDELIKEDQQIMEKYPQLETNTPILDHLHETTALREYFRERFIESRDRDGKEESNS